MPQSFPDGPSLVSRANIAATVKAQDIKYNVPKNQPKCDATQCGIIESNIKKMSASTGALITNVAGGMGMTPDFWDKFQKTFQEFNNKPERNKRLADEKMERD